MLESAVHTYTASASVKIFWQVVIVEVKVNKHDSVEVCPAHVRRQCIAVNIVSSGAGDVYIAVAIIIHIVIAVVHIT